MNLKGFKKINEDEHKAIFKNKDGHAITVAKKGLNKKHLDELKSLPIHAAEGWDGESPEFLNQFEQSGPYSSPEMQSEMAKDKARAALEGNNESIKNAFVSPGDWRRAGDVTPEAPAPKMAEMPMSRPEDAPTLAPEERAPAEEVPSQAPVQTSLAPAQPQAQQSQQDPQQAYNKSYNDTMIQHAEEFGREAALSGQDLRNGHITPKTYQSLFHSQDTMGKIGTLFGLLVSGAGSGLAHQPNTVMEMMNNEIKNDLDAQKQSKTNAQNLYKLMYENELNKAQVGLTKAQTSGAMIDAQIKATTLAKNFMILSSLQGMTDMAGKLPEGAQKANAQTALGGIATAADQQIQQNSLEGAKALANNPEGKFQADQKRLRTMGMLGMEGADAMARSNEEKHVPGIGEASIPVPDKVREEMIAHEKLDNAGRDLLDYSKKHTNLIKGTPEYHVGEQKALILQQMIREGLLGTVFRESEKPLLEKFVDENPAGAFKMFSTQPKIRTLLESNAMASKTLKSRYGLPTEGGHKEEAKSSGELKEGDTGTYKGKPVVVRGGKWRY